MVIANLDCEDYLSVLYTHFYISNIYNSIIKFPKIQKFKVNLKTEIMDRKRWLLVHSTCYSCREGKFRSYISHLVAHNHL